jgi:O-antigen/teichoic acid export membrane protein
LLKTIKSYLSGHEGLGFLQLYNLLKTFAMVLVAIVLANWVRDPLIINRWETLILLATGFSFFYVSGLGYTLVSFVKQYPQSDWSAIFKSCFKLLSLLGLGTAIAIFALSESLTGESIPANELMLISIYAFGSAVGTVLEYKFFLNQQFKTLMVWGILNLVCLVVLPCIPLILEKSFLTALVFLAAYGLFRILITILIIKPFTQTGKAFTKLLMQFNWPVITSLLFGTGYLYIAGFIIKQQVSAVDFNLYRYGSRDFPYFMVMANSFSVVLGGMTASGFGNSDFYSNIRKSHSRLMHQLFPLACLLILIAPLLFEWVFTIDFKMAAGVFNILLFTLIPRLLFPQSILMGLGKTRYSLYASVVEFVFGIVMVYLLTPKYGIYGAAWALSLAYFVEKALLIYFCIRNGVTYGKSLNIWLFVAYSVLLALSFLASDYFFIN